MSEIKSTKVYQALSNTFDVDDVIDVTPKNAEMQPISKEPEDATMESDAMAVRSTLYNLLKQGEEAFEDLKRIAVAEESPRSFEVLNSMLGNLSDIAVKLIEVHERKQKINRGKEPEKQAVNNGTVNNNTVFVGTTSDLQDMIRQISNGK